QATDAAAPAGPEQLDQADAVLELRIILVGGGRRQRAAGQQIQLVTREHESGSKSAPVAPLMPLDGVDGRLGVAWHQRADRRDATVTGEPDRDDGRALDGRVALRQVADSAVQRN